MKAFGHTDHESISSQPVFGVAGRRAPLASVHEALRHTHLPNAARAMPQKQDPEQVA